MVFTREACDSLRDENFHQNQLIRFTVRSVKAVWSTWSEFNPPPRPTCFEQGSLPSLLALSEDASLLVLPGDGMFQAQRIIRGKCRPVILHGYGGAKKEISDSLAALTKFGWIPKAAAMVGLSSSVPLWTGQDWRPILGTSVDTRILPPHLSSKESLLLLSQWIRIPRDDLHIRHATNSWLSSNKVNVALGPDCDLSLHPAREIPLNIKTPYIDMLLGPQKPA